MKPPKARMNELAEKLGILEAGREEVFCGFAER